MSGTEASPATTGDADFDLTALAELGGEPPTISAAARFRGRNRLMAGIGRPSRGWTWHCGTPRARRALASGAVATAVAGGLLAYQAIGPTDAASTAQAAAVLDQAALAVRSTDLAPRPDQFIYRQTLHTTDGLTSRVQTWVAADGSRPGLSVIDSGRNTRNAIAPYAAGQTLQYAPFLVLAKLPTDPDALLKTLYADPEVCNDERANGSTPGVAVWGLIRSLVETAPTGQQAALFKAAAKVPGITYIGPAADARGRVGDAVGLLDPRVGTIELIFDKRTRAFLGERIMSTHDPNTVEFNDSLETIAVVDAPGEVPAA